MDSREVIIVGGGPAGSSCARTLGKCGTGALILDAQDFPRNKLCAGWITPAVIDALEIDVANYPHSLVTFSEIHLEYHGRSIRRRILATTQHSIRRFEFDHWLLQRSGAQFQKHRVSRIARENGWYVIDGRFRCRYLVGAGGTSCPVYRTFFAGLAPRRREFQVAALEEEFACPGRDGACRLWFRENGLPGYSWYVPKGNGWVNVGLGAFCSHLGGAATGLLEHWRCFTRRLEELGLVPRREYDPGGYTYFVRRPGLALHRDNCFVVGDAAGLATRDLAEGIGPAIESGIRAAESIVTGKPLSLSRMTKYSYLAPGIITELAEKLFDRRGGFFRDHVYASRRRPGSKQPAIG